MWAAQKLGALCLLFYLGGGLAAEEPAQGPQQQGANQKQAQKLGANLGVDIDDSVYRLLDAASLRGYIHDLSHYRPYSAKQIIQYLKQIRDAAQLNAQERKIIQRELARFVQNTVAQPDKQFIDFLRDGTVLLSQAKNLPLALRLEFDLKNRLDFISKDPYLFNVMRLYWEGDITPYFSYQAMVGTGLTLIKTRSFAPYGDYVQETAGQAISGGNIQAGEVSFKGDRPSFALQVGGRANASFLNGRVRSGFAYIKRNMGIANTSLIYSGQASPILGWDLSLRPFKWAALNFMVGGLNGIDGDSTSKAMFTAQQFEFFLTRYFYIGITMGSVWLKRLEPYYMMPFFPVALGQSLLGDYDNLAIQGTVALKLPYVKLYGVGFTDEVQPFDAANLFSSLTQQFAFQFGAQILLPPFLRLPFTTFQFQYTKIEPYTYTHYAQRAPSGSNKTYGTINISWMNNEGNLGHYLPPNSDEFLFRLESQPLPGWHFALSYKHIRHGDGDREKGQVEGRTNSVFKNTVNKFHSDKDKREVETELKNIDLNNDGIYTGIYSGAPWYFSEGDEGGGKRPRKNFLHDGPYEYIHIVTLDVGYRFRTVPLEVVGHLMFSHNDGPVYNGNKGDEELRFGFGLDLRFYGKARR